MASAVPLSRLVIAVVISLTFSTGCATKKQVAPEPTPEVPPAETPAQAEVPPPDFVPPPEPVPSPDDQASTGAGEASWYGPGLYGEEMANGEPYDPTRFIAAHRTIELGTRVRVTRVDTGKSVEVVVTDRGPFAEGRIIDLSEAAARELGIDEKGVAQVRLQVVE